MSNEAFVVGAGWEMASRLALLDIGTYHIDHYRYRHVQKYLYLTCYFILTDILWRNKAKEKNSAYTRLNAN